MSVKQCARLFLAALTAVCAILYWPGLHGPFLFDDFPNLAALTSIDHVTSWRDLGIYLSQPRNFPGRPLSMLSFLLQKSDWPDHPFPFKVVNLLIHLLCGLLVYRLALVLSRHYQKERTIAGSPELAACLTAAAWLLNPIQISGVLLVVQRMTLLMAFFVLIGLLLYIKAIITESANVRQRCLWMLTAIVACVPLAFLCKENGLLLPLFALTLDASLLRRKIQQLPKPLRWLRRILLYPPALFVIGYLVWTIPASAAAATGIRDFTLSQRLLTEPRVLVDYIGRIFLPRFGVYGLYNDDFPVSHGLFDPITTLPCLISVCLALATAWLKRKSWPLLTLAVLWYFGGQVLESSTLMLELYFEHRNYVPIIGPLVALAIYVTSLNNKKIGVGLMVLWITASAFTTSLSTHVWQSDDQLALASANAHPDSIRAQNLLMDRLYEHGQLTQAIRIADATLDRHPDSAGIAIARIYFKCMAGSLTPQDIQILDMRLPIVRYDRSGFSNMDFLRPLALNHHCDALTLDRWHDIINALLANPRFSNDPTARGYLHYQLHLAAVAIGDLDGAVRQLDIVYAVDPDAEIPRLQAKYLLSAKLYDQAVQILQTTDYSRLPLLRRLLVNDHTINAEAIAAIRQQQRSVTTSTALPATH